MDVVLWMVAALIAGLSSLYFIGTIISLPHVDQIVGGVGLAWVSVTLRVVVSVLLFGLAYWVAPL